MKDFLKNELEQFIRDKKKIETKHVTINGKSYFLKMVGKDKKEHMKNEIESFDKLKMIPFYNDYFVSSLTLKNSTAILLKYIEGENMEILLKKKCKLELSVLLSLYQLLLIKIKKFHDHNLIHGDVKPANFIIYEKKGKYKIELIDTETVIDLSNPTQIGLDSFLYVPHMKTFLPKIDPFYKKAFSNWNKYRDVYAISLFILYLYKGDLYQKLLKNDKNPSYNKLGKKNRFVFDGIITYPSDYISSNNKLEKILHHVFSKIDKKVYTDQQLELIQLPKVDEILSLFR